MKFIFCLLICINIVFGIHLQNKIRASLGLRNRLRLRNRLTLKLMHRLRHKSRKFLGHSELQEKVSEEPEKLQLLLINNGNKHKTQEEIDAASNYQYCQIKQGYLAFVQFIKFNPEHTHTTKLTARPVFAMLNEKIMAFFNNDQDSDSVIKTISLNSIKPPIIPSDWGQQHCFQLVRSDNAEPFEEPSINQEMPEQEYEASLCTNSNDSLLEWVNAIGEFRNCLEQNMKKLKSQENQEKGEEFEREFREIDAIDEKKSEICEKFNQDAKQSTEDAKNLLQEEIQKIQDKIMERKQIEEAEQRKIDEKIKEESKKTEELENQEKCILKMLSVKDYEQTRIANELLKEEELGVEHDELEKAETEIINHVMRNEQKTKEQNLKIIQEEQKKQAKIKSNLVEITMASEKDLPGSETCYNSQMKKNQDNHIKKTCGNFLQESGNSDLPSITDLVNNCLNKHKFCDTCCSHFIGSQLVVKKTKCHDSCQELIVIKNNQKGVEDQNGEQEEEEQLNGEEEEEEEQNGEEEEEEEQNGEEEEEEEENGEEEEEEEEQNGEEEEEEEQNGEEEEQEEQNGEEEEEELNGEEDEEQEEQNGQEEYNKKRSEMRFFRK